MLPECGVEFAHIRKEFEEMRMCMGDIKKAVCGNGVPGLKLQVDRLEQREQSRVWVNRTIGAAVVGLLLKVGWDLLVKVTSHVQ